MKTMYICYTEDGCFSLPKDSIEKAYESLDGEFDCDDMLPITQCTFFELNSSTGFLVKRGKQTVVIDTFVRK